MENFKCYSVFAATENAMICIYLFWLLNQLTFSEQYLLDYIMIFIYCLISFGYI